MADKNRWVSEGVKDQLDAIGTIFQTTTALASSCPANTRTTVAKLNNLPLGIYIVMYRISSTGVLAKTTNFGWNITGASRGNLGSYACPAASGFLHSVNMTGMVEINNTTNSIEAVVYPGNADTAPYEIANLALTAIKIA